jgi:hypothetical protein
MPLTESGLKVLDAMTKKYGARKGKEVFYASINKKAPGSSKWHGKSEKKHNKYTGALKG